MNTKTFHASSVQDAIRQARRELGADAMLLNSKREPGTRGQPDRFAVSFAYSAAEPETSGAMGTVDRTSFGGTGLDGTPGHGPAVSAAGSAKSPASRAVADQARQNGPTQQSGLARKSDSARQSGHNGLNHSAGDQEHEENPYYLAHRVHQPQHEDSLRVAPTGDTLALAPATASVDSALSGGVPAAGGTDTPWSGVDATESFDKLREQMLSLRREMLQLAGSVRRVSSGTYRQELPNDALRYLYDLLVEQEFHADLIERILESMSEKLGDARPDTAVRGRSEAAARGRAKGGTRRRDTAAPPPAPLSEGTPARLVTALQDAIAAYVDLMPEPGLRRKRTSPLVISLVGPPGAGKTTTLVKLAVRYGEASRFPLQIISMDNFRVGASEQLRAYAAVLGVGFDTLTTVRSLEKAIEEYSAKEIILVDTPGLGWRDFDAADELSTFLRGLDNSITHMVAPASMKPTDFERLADLYEAFDYQSLIYTKLDETTSIGQLVSESWRRHKPLSYFTTGQRIPDDLELASRDRICERILPADALAVNFAA